MIITIRNDTNHMSIIFHDKCHFKLIFIWLVSPLDFKIFQMKTILYATDYSEQSISALKYAHSLAVKLEAQLIVLHVFRVPLSLASPVSISYIKKKKKLFVEHRVKIEKFYSLNLIEHINTLKPIILVDEDNSVVNGIQKKALKGNADFIVVGSKGASKAKQFFLGSTPQGLFKKATCPVLVVPTGATTEYLKTMVYATAFEQSDVFAIRRLAILAKVSNAKIKIIHITTKKEYEGDQQMEWFKELLLEKVAYSNIEFNLIYSDSIFDDLKLFLNESNANLLAMLERSEELSMKRLFHRDFVKRMQVECNIPILSYNVGAL